MDLTLTDEQAMLADAAAAFVEHHRPAATGTAAASGRIDRLDPVLWASMAELGWTAIPTPRPDGGCDNLVETAIVCEALGRGPIPSPLVTSTLLAALPIAALGSDAQRERWLPALASGDAVGTLAVMEPGLHDEWTPPAMRSDASAAASAEPPTLSGTKLLVPWAADASVVVVAAADGLFLVDPHDSGCRATRHDDLGEPMFALDLDAVPAEQLGPPGDAHRAVLERALERAAVAELAFALGSGEAALALSLEHATDRKQFGRPIGSFQAVAHRCVDMRADLDGCRYLAYRAAWALEHADDAGLAVSMALSYGKAALRRVFVHAHQIHGAMGFSTEHTLHLFTRRAKAFELRYGTAGRHLDRVASAMGLR